MWNHLDEVQARELVASNRLAHLGCVLEDGSPYVVPVNYVYRCGSIYIHSLEGTKVQALRKNPNTCVQVEKIHTPFNWKSVIAYGTFEEVIDPGERSAVIDELLSRFADLTPVEGLGTSGPENGNVVIFKISIDKITGVGENC